MTRSQTLKDPTSYLKKRVVQSGKSGVDGTYLLGATVVANPMDFKDSWSAADVLDLLRTTRAKQKAAYETFVTDMIHSKDRQVFFHFDNYFECKGCSMYFERDAGVLNLNVVLSEVEVGEFRYDLENFAFIQDFFSGLTGHSPGSLRFFINYAFISWDDMAEEELLAVPIEQEGF